MLNVGQWPFFVVDAHVYYPDPYGNDLLRDIGHHVGLLPLLMSFGNFDDRFANRK